VSARDIDKDQRRAMRPWSADELVDPALVDPGTRDLFNSAQADTYCMVWYDFEQMNWQGWTRHDNTAQIDTFFHVDDFAGLGGGDYGGLVALEGTKSMWCGTRPGTDEYLCSWVAAPGYGNAWNQMLQTDAIPFSGLLTFSYHGYFDSEPDYDFNRVEYDAGGDNWVEIAEYDGVHDTIAVHELLLSQAATKLRFHFTSDGAWSDQDGLWNTDGACVVDSLLIVDVGGTINYEDFEACPVGTKDCRAKCAGIWWANVEVPFGKYSGLYNNLGDKDPCGDNFATQVVFFVGSPYPSSDYPTLFDTPFCAGPGGIEAPCQDEIIISPVIEMDMYSSGCNEVQDTPIPPADLPELGGAYYRFTVYRDLPVANLVFYVWHVRNIDAGGCPGQWQDRNFVYYGPDMDYIYTTQDVSDLIGGDPQVQLAVGCVDMCDVWYGVYGNCAAHTPSPWFDNIRLYRFKTTGPQWSYRSLDLFQDNFPEVEFNLESDIRADAANDLRPNDDPVIDPGDSIVVDCTSPLGGGIDTTPDGKPMVFMHVAVHYIGDPLNPKPDLFGPSLEGTYGTYYSDNGQWTIIQGEPARTGAGNVVEDRYMFDLNDSLFTRGYCIGYYFKAYDRLGASSTLPSDAEDWVCVTPPPRYPFRMAFFEFWGLPTLASDILFVDDFHGRGTLRGVVEDYWGPSFAAVITPENQPDRYDVNGPSSLVSNGPGSRAKNYQMTTAYHKVIWDSGNLESGTITEGTGYSDKSNDCQMLIDWMQFSEHDVGLWICGDEIAFDLSGGNPGGPPAACALELMTTWCGVEFVHTSYFDLTGGRLAGGVVTPNVDAVPDANNPLWHTTWGDSFYVFGGCPIINQFDVLEKAGTGQYALQYPDYLGLPYYAGIYNNTINDGGYDVRTMWFGFSFMYIRDKEEGEPIMRNQVVKDVVGWMQNPTNSDITEGEVPNAYSLSQNFPNPFNPTTTIKFGLREKGLVTLKIYNVAGQLVKTLVNEVRDAGNYEITWDGSNNHDLKVASGVYFYKMNTKNFKETKKMVLLR
jgi:hypothetical protein